MAGLGYRREMADWDMSQVAADFFEVVPENWIRRDRAPLHRLRESGRPIHLHGVSLNLGGTAAFQTGFLHALHELMGDLEVVHYSDHLAASGDAHQLYDLFPVPFTQMEAIRVAGRIMQVQDVLGRRIGIENTTWYTNVGEMGEADFLREVAGRADCHILLDINNLDVNHKNHGGLSPVDFIAQTDLSRVTYLHVAGHEFDERFGLFVDTHSQPVASPTRELALRMQREHGLSILLEWDNDLPDQDSINRELSCLHSTTT